MKNLPSDWFNAPASCAGHFIEQHLQNGPNFKGVWIHCDMGFPWDGDYNPTMIAKGHASGFGVCLVTSLFKEHYQNNKLY